MNILDIAAAAGVSSATVSRVLNNGKVSPEARAKVEAVIRQMNYLPNNLARTLITGKSMNIGVVTHSLSNSYSWEFVEAVSERLKELGYRMFVASSGGDPEEEAKYLSSFLSQKVDGIILHDTSLVNYDSGFFLEVSKRVPFVMVHLYDQITDIHSVIVDQALGMGKVMHYLLGAGHRKIWFVRSHGDSQNLKEQVWRDALTLAGCPPDDDDVVFLDNGDQESGVLEAEEAIAQRLRDRLPPTAIFACNDLMALGVQTAVTASGLRIPEDLSLVGHYNTFLAEVGKFSSVDLKRNSVGHAAVDLLLSSIAGKDKEARRVYLTPELVLRRSTRSLSS